MAFKLIKETIMNKKNTYKSVEELKNYAPKLSSLNSENPFKVPDEYFENLSAKINSKISESADSDIDVKVSRSLFNSKVIYALAAASITIFISVFILLNRNSSNDEFFSDITLEQILEESPEIIESMEDYIIVEIFLANNDITESIFENEIQNDSVLSTDEIIDYLSDDEIDIELMYN